MDLALAFQAILLGLIEGATEFLPISSTGHLIIAADFLQFNSDRGRVFEIVIQLGAILAICWEYRLRLMQMCSRPGDPKTHHLLRNLLVAFMPAAVLGVTFHSSIKAYLFSPTTVACALILGGIVILVVERTAREPVVTSLETLDMKTAMKIGVAQSCALIPGVSRAGATILGGVIFGLSRKTATEFSFFLAIPIMFSATGYDLYKNWSHLNADHFALFALGFVAAFVSALFVVRLLLRYVSNHDFRLFAWYRIALGTLVLVYFHY